MARLFFRFERYILVPIRLAAWSRRPKERFISPVSSCIGPASLGLETDQLEKLTAVAKNSARVEIGEFDQDGFLLSKFGPIHGLPGVSAADYAARKRSTLRLVLLGDKVAVEKDFRGARCAFVREVSALLRLNAAGSREHAILDINVRGHRLTVPFIRGKVLREELAKTGAVVRDRDVTAHPLFQGLSTKLADRKRIEAGRSFLHRVVTGEFIDKLYRRLQDIHAVGVAHLGIKYGNIIIDEDSRGPRLIDFGEASPVGFSGKLLFNILRDYDTEQFNLHFDTEYLTYNLIRRRIRQTAAKNSVYLGYGLSLGNWRKARACEGLWLDFINQNFPNLAGKRVLSLGSSNGYPALQCLRMGARQVVVIEPVAELLKEAQFVRDAFEWKDNRRYDAEFIQMDPLDLAIRGVGPFDIVFVCGGSGNVRSTDILIKHLSTIARVLVFQCGFRDDKANVVVDGFVPQPQLRRLLEENGFRIRDVSAERFNRLDFILAEAR